MERINTPTREQGKHGTGPFGDPRDGFTNGNPVTGLASTQLEADWFDATQEEAARAIELAGIRLWGDDQTAPGGQYEQLYAAINAIASGIAGNYVLKTGDTMTGPLILNLGAVDNYLSFVGTR